ncbi:hypothetical protein DID78_01225 [Candidatus Marinamargulisbacteria bacterium SCGC AG-343-D04]|nr:hypothetical protein DID78_01225 [Candidatus Marinamargulisbacteria bacterium SCGC AG-343-D04]
MDVVDPVPSLFSFTIQDKQLCSLMGLSVANATITVPGFKPQEGALLITHWGMSGPAIIKASAWSARYLHECGYRSSFDVDWLPGFSHEDVFNRFSEMKNAGSNQQCQTQSLFSDIPLRLWRYFLTKCDADGCTWSTLSQKKLRVLVDLLKKDRYSLTAKGVFKEEFVTSGGVNCDTMSMKTMESKAIPGLFVVGECLNIDGVTGGFNFQNAWSTGYIAGMNVGK